MFSYKQKVSFFRVKVLEVNKKNKSYFSTRLFCFQGEKTAKFPEYSDPDSDSETEPKRMCMSESTGMCSITNRVDALEQAMKNTVSLEQQQKLKSTISSLEADKQLKACRRKTLD